MIRWILKSSPGQSTAASPCRWSPSCAAGVWPQLQPGRRWNWSWPAGRTWSTGTALLGQTSGTELQSWSGRRQRKKTRIRIGINEMAPAPSPPDLLCLCPPAFISPLIYKYWTKRQPWILRRLEVAMKKNVIKIASISRHYIGPSLIMGCSSLSVRQTAMASIPKLLSQR